LSLQDEGIYKEEGIVPAVFNLGIVWAWVVHFMPQLFSSGEKLPCTHWIGNIIEIVVFRDVSPFNLIGGCRCFGEIYYLYHELDIGNMTSYQESALLLSLIARASHLIYNRCWETRNIFQGAGFKNNFLCSKFMSQSVICFLFCSSQNMTMITYPIVCIVFIKIVLWVIPM
jgi:hypothetical protein